MDTSNLYGVSEKVNRMKQERDVLNQQILQERQVVAQKELELMRARQDFGAVQARLSDKEQTLLRFNQLIAETEQAYMKLQANTDRLRMAIDQESQNLQNSLRKFN